MRSDSAQRLNGVSRRREPLIVQQAKHLAREWVLAHGPALPGYCGAFVHGSANWLADDAVLPPTSDLDVMVVIAGAPGADQARQAALCGACC